MHPKSYVQIYEQETTMKKLFLLTSLLCLMLVAQGQDMSRYAILKDRFDALSSQSDAETVFALEKGFATTEHLGAKSNAELGGQTHAPQPFIENDSWTTNNRQWSEQ